MFGMTKKQFLKRSKKVLNQTGGILLLTREIMDKEKNGRIDNHEALTRVDDIRKEIESIFFQFEKRKPPSSCIRMHLRILRSLTNFQEAITLNSEYLNAIKNGRKEEAGVKLEKSIENLEEFRKEFHVICDEINRHLTKK